MVTLNQLKKRRKNAFMKEATALSDKYSRIISHHMSLNFTKFANECFNLVEKYTCDCCKEREKKRERLFDKGDIKDE